MSVIVVSILVVVVRCSREVPALKRGNPVRLNAAAQVHTSTFLLVCIGVVADRLAGDERNTSVTS